MLAIVPVNATTPLPLVPLTIVSPEVLGSVTFPFVAVRVTLTAAMPASTSAMLIALPLADE